MRRIHRHALGAALLLLVLALSLQRVAPATQVCGSAGPRAGEGPVHVLPDAGSLEIDGAGMCVRITRAPWRLDVFAGDRRLLVQGDESAGAPVFVLEAATLAHLLPAGQPLPAGDAGQVLVHPRHLLPQWRLIPDGATVWAATDDPLGRVATVTIRLVAPGVVEMTARLGIGSRWPDGAVVATTLTMRSGSDEHFFGLGEQFGGADARGRRVGMLVQDGITTDRPLGGYAPVPFFVSSRGYGFYLAGARPSVFALDVGGARTWQVTASTTAPTWYILDGPRPPDVIARYADLTGHPPLPPPWTLGVWKTLVGGRDRVLAAARRLRAEHIPVSVIWTYDAVDESVDLGWPAPVFAPIPIGSYPDLPSFTATLHRLGYTVLGYVSPEFTPGRPSFRYPARHGYFVHGIGSVGGTSSARSAGGHIYLLDLTNPSAVRWWQDNLRRILTPLGFDGWFQDLGDRLPHGARFANGRGALDMANLYPLLYARTAEAVAQATKPDALLVMRSGVAGIQRYQRAVWAGDQRMTWNRGTGFPAVITAGLSWGIAQAPFWGSDIGGYLEGRPPLSRAAQEELYLRWVEFGAFSPIMRDTLGDKGRHAIYMDSDARTLGAFRRYAQLHQQLFPYFYAAARVAHLTGLPIMRHLFLAYPTDPRVYGLDDEYLLGPDLLVAPVTAPGVDRRTVYLPAGAWVDYWSGVALSGGAPGDGGSAAGAHSALYPRWRAAAAAGKPG